MESALYYLSFISKSCNLLAYNTVFMFNTTGPGMLVLSVVAGSAVFILLVVLSLIIFPCKRRHDNHKRRDTLLDNEGGLSDNNASFHDDCSAVFDETTKTLKRPDGTESCAILNMDWTIV